MSVEILIADDHAIIREGVRKIISDTSDLRVAGEASNGHDVLQMVQARNWDAVLLDMSMPGRNGIELIKLLKAQRPQLPILVFSMHAEEQYAVRAIRAGAAGYLAKESDSELLVPALRKVAHGGLYISPKVAELLATDISPQGSGLPHTQLTNREFEIFSRIVRGDRLTDIANELSLSIKTVSTHKSHIMGKMQLENGLELLRYAMEHGLVNSSSKPLDSRFA